MGQSTSCNLFNCEATLNQTATANGLGVAGIIILINFYGVTHEETLIGRCNFSESIANTSRVRATWRSYCYRPEARAESARRPNLNSAISGEQIQDAAINSFNDLDNYIPNFQVSDIPFK